MTINGGNGQHFSWGFFSLVPFNPNPINPLRIKAKSQMRTKMLNPHQLFRQWFWVPFQWFSTVTFLAKNTHKWYFLVSNPVFRKFSHGILVLHPFPCIIPFGINMKTIFADGVLIAIECKAWARNIDHDSQDRKGLVHFEVCKFMNLLYLLIFVQHNRLKGFMYHK